MSEPIAWIQPDHLQKARQAPFLCRVEPTQRCADFVPLYLHPAPSVEPVGFLIQLALGWAQRETEKVVKLTRHSQPEHGFTEPLYATPPDHREVMRMALEALENCTSEHGHRCIRCDSEVDEGGKVIAALRAALGEKE